MSENEKKIKFKWFEKLKNVKHIEIYVAIIVIVLVLLIYFSTTKTKESKKKYANDNSVTGYIQNLEIKLEETLSNIAGISDVDVMISIDIEYLKIQDSQIVITEFPSIKGVVVTAKGVNNTTNKMKVLHAIEAVIDVTNGNIEILSSE